MKRRSREVSIFSMSALDLFASALGAFILLAIVMFPYFPNTGMASQADLEDALGRLRAAAAGNEELQQIHDELNQAIGGLREELATCRDRADRLAVDLGAAQEESRACREATTSQQAQIDAQQRRIDDLEFPHLDFVVALDVTGSMEQEIRRLKTEIDEVFSILLRLAPSVAVGVVAFGDREWPQPVTQFRLVGIGSEANRTRLAAFVDSLSANMGMRNPANPTPPEAFLAGVRAAVNMPWRSQAERRQIVVITDNPAYPEDVETTVALASSFAAGTDGASVSTVFVRSENTQPGTEAFLARVASTGGGVAVQAEDSMTANLLLSLL